MHSKKGCRIIVWVLFLLVLGVIAIVLFYGEKHEYLFVESDSYLGNPDRGIYVQAFTDDMDYYREKYAVLEGKENIRVILLAYDLNGFENDKFLSKEKLEELREALEVAKEEEVSVVFRAAYDFDGECNDPIDVDIICNHVEQIAEILMDYQENLICIQAGMLGPWGEWHSSEYIDSIYTKEAHKVLITWLENTSDVDIALRRPSYLRDAVTMGAGEKRLTIHNDALLSTESDMGTYNDEEYLREEELEYIGNLSSTYMGGEMSKISEYSEFENAIDEFSQMNISYLNRYYNEDVWEMWESENYDGIAADEYIIKHVGYRLSLEKMEWNDWLFFQQFDIYINNTGFGKLDPKYQFYLVIEGEDESRTIKLTNVEDGLYQCNIWQWFDREQEYDLGILISKRGINCRNPLYNIELANDETNYQYGINYLN